MDKLGFKPVEGIYRVSCKQTETVMIGIDDPEVYKDPYAERYFVFGQIKEEDPSKVSMPSQEQPSSVPAKEEESSEVNADGLEEKDIAVVMQQADVSRAKACEALKANDNDIVNAILELSI